MGDINLDMMKQNGNIYFWVCGIVTEYEYKYVIEKPTRNDATLIDHIITNITEIVANQDVLPCPTITDHDASFITVNTKSSSIWMNHDIKS